MGAVTRASTGGPPFMPGDGCHMLSGLYFAQVRSNIKHVFSSSMSAKWGDFCSFREARPKFPPSPTGQVADGPYAAGRLSAGRGAHHMTLLRFAHSPSG